MSASNSLYRSAVLLFGAVALTLVSSGCVHHHSSDSPSVYRSGAPPASPSHGYRHHHDGMTLVFDHALASYVVRGHDAHYFRGNRYYRYRDGRWAASEHFWGPWSWVEAHRMPHRLRDRHARDERRELMRERRDERQGAAREHREERREVAKERSKQRKDTAKERREERHEVAKERSKERKDAAKEHREERRDVARHRSKQRKEAAKERREDRHQVAKDRSEQRKDAAKANREERREVVRDRREDRRQTAEERRRARQDEDVEAEEVPADRAGH